MGDIETEELTGLLTGFRGKAKNRAEVIRKGEAIKGEATEIARDNGYEMLLCSKYNNYFEEYKKLTPIVEEERKISRSRSRSRSRSSKKKAGRTRKRALKKRHRRKRRTRRR